MRKQFIVIFLGLCALALLYCTEDNIAGNSSQDGNVSGRLAKSDGTPAAGVAVRFIRADHNPRQGLGKILAATDSAVTDAGGRYAVTLDSGTYNMLAKGDTTLAYQDSIITIHDSTITIPTDTLKAPGSIRGAIRLQGTDDARTVFILFMGTNTWATPDNAAGAFTVADMAEGAYRVRILTTLDAYLPKDTVLSVIAGKIDSLAHDITLQYTGIPVVSGLAISYDTLKQIVTLTWNRPTTGRNVSGYNIYRKLQDSALVKIKSAVSDTMFVDSTLRASATYEYRVAAVDTQNTEGVQSAGIIVDFQSRFNLITSAAVFGRRQEHTSVVFDNKMWVIAGTDGYNLKNDVWYSTDGKSWTQATDSASFAKRRGHTSVVFNNKMWVIGGLADNGSGGLYDMNDVWYSIDGISWTQATNPSDSIFTGRLGHASIVFNSKMWVIGGSANSGLQNDAWYSTTGISWIKATSSAAFSGRVGHRLFVFSDKMWLVGGNDNSGFKNDIWNTQDGVTWTKITNSANFGERAAFSIDVLDSTIWLIGGYGMPSGSLGSYDDAWYSIDGSLWKGFNIPPTFTAKSNHTSVVFSDTLWIIGANNSSSSDIWSLK